MESRNGSTDNNRIIEIQQGYELSIHVADDIWNDKAFMYGAYCQAINAVRYIVEQTRIFYNGTSNRKSKENQEELSDRLFGYGGNIIAFAAQRGGGKTSTMLSFSRMLKQSKDESISDSSSCKRNGAVCHEDILKKCRFYVLPPIAPSALKERQSVLHVILSRLYYHAIDQIENSSMMNQRIKDSERRELIQAFHKCLSGINNIKYSEKNNLIPEDIAALQETGDGILLRKYFFELIQSILKITDSHEAKHKQYIVIQLDDADSQIENGYAMLDDIRKYLVIPNLIILMSADIQVLHNVIMQNHLQQFKDLSSRLSDKEPLLEELTRICQKYIDKLIPPSHLIHLPSLERCIAVGGDCLKLHYKCEREMVYDWAENLSLQTMLLTLIYKKTGIVFAKPSNYMHNIIPRTLRGLNQVVHFLSSLQDVPRLGIDEATKKAWEDRDSFIEALYYQISIAEKNLAIFADYFAKDWINVKVSHAKDRVFLRKLGEAIGSNRVRMALQYLRKRYPDEDGAQKKDEAGTPVRFCIPNNVKITFDRDEKKEASRQICPFIPDNLKITFGRTERDNVGSGIFSDIQNELRISLDTVLSRLEKKYRMPDDFLLYFSIRTLLTLETHRLVLYEKRVQLREAQQSEKGLIVFDFNPEKICSPQMYVLDDGLGDEQIGTIENTPILIQSPKTKWNRSGRLDGSKQAIWRSAKKCLIHQNTLNEDTLDSMAFITLLLRCGMKNSDGQYYFKISECYDPEKQKQIYQIQEHALLYAANWDIQHKLGKYLPEVANEEMKFVNEEMKFVRTGTSAVMTAVLKLYELADAIISKVNDGVLSAMMEEEYLKKCGLLLAYETICKDVTDVNKVIEELLKETTASSQKESDSSSPLPPNNQE